MRWSELFEGINLDRFVELAKKCSDVDEFIRRTDGMDVLYRGHYDNETSDNSFMTDYVGHAGEYGGGEGADGRIDAFAYSISDVWFYNDDRFNELRSAYRRLDKSELIALYRDALRGNRHAAEFTASLPKVARILWGSVPYSEICNNPEKNDPLVPLLQKFARDRHGKNIIAFHGGDYADYGGQTEYVVGSISKLIDLRKLYQRVKAS